MSLIHTFRWPNFFTQFLQTLFKSRAHETMDTVTRQLHLPQEKILKLCKKLQSCMHPLKVTNQERLQFSFSRDAPIYHLSPSSVWKIAITLLTIKHIAVHINIQFRQVLVLKLLRFILLWLVSEACQTLTSAWAGL